MGWTEVKQKTTKITKKVSSQVSSQLSSVFLPKFETSLDKKVFQYVGIPVCIIMGISAAWGRVPPDGLIMRSIQGDTTKGSFGGEIKNNLKFGLDDWENSGKYIWGQVFGVDKWVQQVEKTWLKESLGLNDTDFGRSLNGGLRSLSSSVDGQDGRSTVSYMFEADEENCEEMVLADAFAYPWDSVPVWGNAMQQWWDEGLIRAGGKINGTANTDGKVNKMWTTLNVSPITEENYEFNRFMCVLHREAKVWFRFESASHPKTHTDFNANFPHYNMGLTVAGAELSKFWDWMETMKTNEPDQWMSVMRHCQKKETEFRRTEDQSPTVFKNLALMQNPWLKMRALEQYTTWTNRNSHRFQSMEVIFARLLEVLSGTENQVEIPLALFKINWCALEVAEYTFAEWENLRGALFDYAKAFFADDGFGWYINDKMPSGIFDFSAFTEQYNPKPGEDVSLPNKVRLNDAIFNQTLNYGGFLLADGKKGDDTWEWKDPQDLHPHGTIISPNTYVPLTGWAYKQLEFPLLNKPEQMFHNVVKVSKKYWIRNYDAFKTIYNMVGYTFYDQLWMDLEQGATKTEAEQMAWLTKQPFNQDTRDCTVHAGNFTTWLSYKQWATKQLKLQVVSYQPRIKEIGFTQSNCRYTRWMAFMKNPRNYELMGYEIDTGVIMANTHHQLHWYLRDVRDKMQTQAMRQVLSVGLIAWEVFMMIVNLILLRMGLVYLRSTPGKVFAMMDGRDKHKANIAKAVKEREARRITNKELAIDEYIRENPEKQNKLDIVRNLGEKDRQDMIEKLRSRLCLNDENSDYIYESNYFELALTRTANNAKRNTELTEHNHHHFRKSKIPTKHNGRAPYRMKFERLQDISIFVGLYIFVLPLAAEFFVKFNGLHRGKDAVDPSL